LANPYIIKNLFQELLVGTFGAQRHLLNVAYISLLPRRPLNSIKRFIYFRYYIVFFSLFISFLFFPVGLTRLVYHQNPNEVRISFMGKVRGEVSATERLVGIIIQTIFRYIIIFDWYFNQTLQMYNTINNLKL